MAYKLSFVVFINQIHINMKKLVIIGIGLIATVNFSACKTDDSATKADLAELSNYVDSVKNVNPVYTETQWKMIDEGYQPRNTKVEQSMASLDDASKAKVEEDRKKYEALKASYEKKIKENEDANKGQIALRVRLLGEGHPGPNNDFAFVTKDNIVSVYKNFVDKVRDNGDNYSDAEWIEIRLLWKALNDRKEAINSNISTIDKITIDHLRVAYLAVKAVNKPVSQLKDDKK